MNTITLIQTLNTNTVAELINQLDDQIEELASFKDSITVYIDELVDKNIELTAENTELRTRLSQREVN
mgnify:CR=1 FL=1